MNCRKRTLKTSIAIGLMSRFDSSLNSLACTATRDAGCRRREAASNLDDLHGRAAQECQILGVGREDGDRPGCVAGDDGEGGIDGVLVAVAVMGAQKRDSLVGDLLGDVVNVDAGEDPRGVALAGTPIGQNDGRYLRASAARRVGALPGSLAAFHAAAAPGRDVLAVRGDELKRRQLSWVGVPGRAGLCGAGMERPCWDGAGMPTVERAFPQVGALHYRFRFNV